MIAQVQPFATHLKSIPTMKKALIALYVIVAGQSLLIVLACIVSYFALPTVLHQVGERMGEMFIKIGDNRYVRQQPQK